MTSQLLVAADVRLEHLLSASADDIVWHGWTIGGPAVRAGTYSHQAIVSVGTDSIGTKARRLLDPTTTELVSAPGRTAQTFRITGPPIGLQGHRGVTSRCPLCSRIHTVDRHRRARLLETQADFVLADSLRTEIIEVARRSRQRRGGAVAVLDDPAFLRFMPIGDIVSRLAEFDALVASGPVAAILTRRLKIERDRLVETLGVRELHVASEAHEFRDDGGDVWRDLMRPDNVELAARAAIARRQHASHLPDGRGQGTHKFGAPLRLSSLPRAGNTCPLCGSPLSAARNASRDKPGPAPVIGATHNLGWLRRRMLNAADSSAVELAQTLLSWEGTAQVVASGGSAVAASFIAQLLRERSGLFASETFPSDYVATGVATDALVLVSFSGNTPDHIPVIRRARELGVQRIALICHSPQPRLGPELGPGGLVIAYGNPRREARAERGFVSMAATVAPCAMLLAASDGTASLAPLARPGDRGTVRMGRVLGDAVRRNCEVHVLGSGYARSAMLDLESKWVEGDLGPITVHQSKDFSHGRFMSLLGSGRPAVPVMLSVGEDDVYEHELLGALGDEHIASDGLVDRPLRLASSYSGLLGALELLIDVQEVAVVAGSQLGKDLSRPERIDPGGLRLYAWKSLSTEAEPAHPKLLPEAGTPPTRT